MIELVMPSSGAAEAVKVIREKGKTGAIGDVKIFVLLSEEAIRIRTGESGCDSL
jgi:nitrogen regulatory protein P-II 1